MHFGVAVLTDGTCTVDELLEQYDENKKDVFVELSKELTFKYVNDTINRVLTDHDEYISCRSPEIKKIVTKEEYDKFKGDKKSYYKQIGTKSEIEYAIFDPDIVSGKIIKVPWTDIYPSYEEFVENEYEDYYDKSQNKYGEWTNPNAKWDYYTIGGRYKDFLKSNKSNERFNSALIKDVDFSDDKKAYDKAIRFWEIRVENSPPKEGEVIPTPWEYNKEALLKYFENKEIYAKASSAFSMFAIITPDGKWYEEPCYEAMKSKVEKKRLDWSINFKKNFIDSADPNWTITIVDCHN